LWPVSVSVQALPAILDGQQLVKTLGLPLLLFVVFAETGLLLGFFLPGDSLLFAAGYAASGGIPGVDTPPVAVVCLLMSLVAIAGAQTGFMIGRKAGPALFQRPDSRMFKQVYVDKAEEALGHYGPAKAIVIARFVPIVRTFLNPLAGVVHLPARIFLLWNVVGGVLWGTGVTLVGYYLGQVSFIGKNLEVFAVLVVLLSVIPIALELRKTRRSPT
jgi:membrane-associated protein